MPQGTICVNPKKRQGTVLCLAPTRVYQRQGTSAMNTYELILNIARQPVKYLDGKSLRRLDAFICGHGYGYLFEQDCFEGFNDYLYDKYDIHVQRKWSVLIQIHCSSDEEAFDKFIELIQEYQRQKDSHKDNETKINEGTAEVLPDIMVIDEMPAVKMRDLIIEIIKRPPMYLGDYSLEKLYYYLKGFVMSHTDANDGCLDGFNTFVSEKLSINASVAWWKIINIYSSTEKEAFYKFVDLLHEYWQKATAGDGLREP